MAILLAALCFLSCQREAEETPKTGADEPGASADETTSTKQPADDVTADAQPQPSATPSDEPP